MVGRMDSAACFDKDENMRKKIYGIAAAVCLSRESMAAGGCSGKESGRDTACHRTASRWQYRGVISSETKNDSNTDADNGAENSEVAAGGRGLRASERWDRRHDTDGWITG